MIETMTKVTQIQEKSRFQKREVVLFVKWQQLDILGIAFVSDLRIYLC